MTATVVFAAAALLAGTAPPAVHYRGYEQTVAAAGVRATLNLHDVTLDADPSPTSYAVCWVGVENDLTRSGRPDWLQAGLIYNGAYHSYIETWIRSVYHYEQHDPGSRYELLRGSRNQWAVLIDGASVGKPVMLPVDRASVEFEWTGETHGVCDITMPQTLKKAWRRFPVREQ